MVAVDTNVLVYAHRREFAEHDRARATLSRLADGDALWALPVFCLGEFLRVVTHHAILRPPSSLDQATQAIDALLASPSLRVLTPGERFPSLLAHTVRESGVTGNLVFDAQIAAVCLEHGVHTVISNDRDLSRFAGISRQALTG
ncbi:MAG: PIN domain-containing protein [Acidobacteriota bacterium]|nr:PIN domain-containing protein [Acidobacteriota bacterium]